MVDKGLETQTSGGPRKQNKKRHARSPSSVALVPTGFPRATPFENSGESDGEILLLTKSDSAEKRTSDGAGCGGKVYDSVVSATIGSGPRPFPFV